MPTPNRNVSPNQAGFSLVELLVVLAILGLLASLVGPQVLKYIGTSKVGTAKMQIESFSTALDLYKLDEGRYPSSEEGLKALLTAPTGQNHWAGPYLKGKSTSLDDPWGHPYIYHSPGQHGEYDLFSHGPDAPAGATNGDADAGPKAITSW